ncbi:hypothetical protein DFA_11382 [Cavenderia fasciculata]|uniref:Uncharacterized protein n=1 Tax=Cavenderia fasciculata TaxID=261658 RepID=F4QCN9_CACFS|nr:uncharacterized protein DFA_11382 [Cavenderia fasciculata]EGG13621.1 hypothetical protein DFA_11382 [Cavenderia fasciculata]|eukprot:XP_004350325.1 hypothetical protein DFA_11382 [Cavenderia fasciculata]
MMMIGYIRAFDICTPARYQAISIGTNGAGQTERREVYYDAYNYSVRIDISTDTTNQTTFSYFSPNNSQTGQEWVIDQTGNCYQTGPDYWNPQCWGDSYGTPFVSNTNNMLTFSNPSNGYTAIVAENGLPMKIVMEYSGLVIYFYESQSYISDPSVFNLPKICKQQE